MTWDLKRRPARAGRPPASRAGEIDACILAAATDMFLARGYEATSYDGVAALSGVSKATLYARHPTKPDLFAAMIRSNVTAALVPGADVPPDLPARERLRIAGRAVIQGAMQDVPLSLMRLFIAEVGRHGDLIREVDRSARAAAVTTIARAIAGKQRIDPGIVERAKPAATRFLDLAFVPHQMRALIGDAPESLHSALEDRIAVAIAALEASGHLPVSGTEPDDGVSS